MLSVYMLMTGIFLCNLPSWNQNDRLCLFPFPPTPCFPTPRSLFIYPQHFIKVLQARFEVIVVCFIKFQHFLPRQFSFSAIFIGEIARCDIACMPNSMGENRHLFQQLQRVVCTRDPLAKSRPLYRAPEFTYSLQINAS